MTRKFTSSHCLMALLASLSIAACAPKADNNYEQTASSNEVPSIGKSWDFINEHGIKAVWQSVETPTNDSNVVSLKTHFKNTDGSINQVSLEVLFEATDHVAITQRNAQGVAECQYIGHIWIENSLDDYDSFSEDPTLDNQPVFYRIVTGTYSCDGMQEPETWMAKINE